MFVTVNKKITVHAEFVGMFMKYRHVKLHMLASDGSLIINTEVKQKN
jgi:hypothetical protein